VYNYDVMTVYNKLMLLTIVLVLAAIALVIYIVKH
jgi:hypothetical protein